MVRIIKVSSACANILFNKESDSDNFVVTIYKTIKEKIHVYIYSCTSNRRALIK